MLCQEGKRRYATRATAEQVMQKFLAQWGEDDPLAENMNVYLCKYCQAWHMGHVGGKTRDQQLIEEIRRIRHMYE